MANNNRDNSNGNGNGSGKVTKADLIWTAIMVITILFAAGAGYL